MTSHNDKLIIIGALYLAYQIVVVPCRRLVEFLPIGAQEVLAAHDICLLKHDGLPPDVCHVLRVLLVACIFYSIVLGYGRVFLDGPAHALDDLLIVLLAVLLRQ